MDGVDLTKCIDKKRIVGSTNCLREYQCFNQDFMLASDDYYAIFSKKWAHWNLRYLEGYSSGKAPREF